MRAAWPSPFEVVSEPDDDAKLPGGRKKLRLWNIAGPASLGSSCKPSCEPEDETMTSPVTAIRILAPEPHPSAPVPPPGKPAPPVKEPMPDKQGDDGPAPDPDEDGTPLEAAP